MSTGCKYNQVNSHFHCIREGCQFSFLLKHQMTSHARKHMRRMLGKNFDRVPSSQVSLAGRLPLRDPGWQEGITCVPLLLPGGGPGCPKRQPAPVGSTAPSPASSGPRSSFQGPQSLMDTETDEYMDYTGYSPGAVSSESSTMDRSCSSTPVGNESTAAGERAARKGQRGPGSASLGQAPPSKAQQCWVRLRTGGSWSSGLKGGRARVWQHWLLCGTWVPACCHPAHLPGTLPSASVSRREPGLEL